MIRQDCSNKQKQEGLALIKKELDTYMSEIDRLRKNGYVKEYGEDELKSKIARMEREICRQLLEESREMALQVLAVQDSEEAQKKIKRYDDLSREKRVLEYLIKELPDSEERIAEPMNINCEVSVVIPCYCERKNLLRPLESLANQEYVSPNQYEVIVVVNNPGSAPEKKTDEAGENYMMRLKSYYEAVEDNRESLKIIEYINGKNIHIHLSEQEKNIIKKIKEVGVKIFAVDKVNPGKTLPGKEASCGGARNRGLAEAVSRFYELGGKNGIIAHTDADTSVDEHYIRNLIKIFKERPELVGITGLLGTEVIGDSSEQLRNASKYLYMKDLYENILLYSAKGRPNRQEQDLEFEFQGANMASRAFEAAIAGGILKRTGSENLDFRVKLLRIGKIDKINEIEVVTAIRYSSTEDGYGEGLYNIMTSLKERNTFDVASIENILHKRQLNEYIIEAVNSNRLAIDTLKKLLNIGNRLLLNNEDIQLFYRKLKELKNIYSLKKEFIEDDGLNSLFEKIKKGIDEEYPPEDFKQGFSLLLELLCMDDRIMKKYELFKVQLIENTARRGEVIEYLLDHLFNNQMQYLNKRSLAALILSIFEEKGASRDYQPDLISSHFVINKLAELIASSKNKQEALENIRLYFGNEFTVPVDKDSLEYKYIELMALAKASLDS